MISDGLIAKMAEIIDKQAANAVQLELRIRELEILVQYLYDKVSDNSSEIDSIEWHLGLRT